MNKAVIEALESRILLSIWTVNTNSDLTTDDGSPGHNLCLRQAISQADAAGGNQTINIASSLAGSTITLMNGVLTLNDTSGTLNIQGPTASSVTINAQNQSSVFFVFGQSLFTNVSNLAITGGSGYYGGGIDNNGRLTVTNCTISGNAATGSGGGIESPTSLKVINSTISGNTAPTGAGITNAGTTIIINSTITGNTSTGAGGGIYSPNIGVNVIDSTISGNSATSGGGILGPTSGSSLRGSIVAKNTGGDLSGVFSGSNNLIGDSLSALTGSNNFLGDPYLSTLGFYGGPTKTMVPRPVSGSQAFGNGYGNLSYTTDQRGFLRPTTSPDIGAFQTQSDPLLVNTTQDGPVGPGFLTLRNAINLAGAFNVNQIDYVDFASTLTTGGAATINLNGTPLFANVTTGLLLILGPGSGLLTVSAQNHSSVLVNDSNSEVMINDLTLTGGINDAIDNYAGYVTLTGCTIKGNSGGVYNYFGTLNISNSTLSGNTSSNNGGAIYSYGGTVSITNSTISGNTAAAKGGGIYDSSRTTMTVIDSTISGNSAAGSGGGIFGGGTLDGTIIANSTSGADLSGTFSGNDNLVDDGSGLPAGAGNIRGNPLLSTLGNYGGITQTYALLPGSLALNAGYSSPSIRNDQRGVMRPRGSVPDIGAYQSQGFTLTISGGNSQTTTVGTPFTASLAIQVTAVDSLLTNLQGGVITFAAPTSGPSATLGIAAPLNSSGVTSVTATANNTVGGPYAVTASSGKGNSPSFSLTNISAVTVVPIAPSLGGGTDDAPGGTAFGADGGNPGPPMYSGDVRYFDGSVTLSTTDIAPADLGLISGQTRTWTDEPGVATSSLNGNNVVVSQWPSIIQESGGSILAVSSGQTTRWFDPSGSAFTERFYGQDTLASDGSSGYFLTDSAGNRFDYFGFGAGINPAERGQLQSLIDPGNNLTSFTYGTNGLLQQINRYQSNTTLLEDLKYTYQATGMGGSMQLSSVEMDRLVNGTMAAVESANYIYYGAANGTTFGRVGDLEQVTVNEFESGLGGTVSVPINYDLYRYDPTTGLLLYAVEGNAYERYSANVSNPLTDNSGAIAQYANEAFTYFGAGSGSQSGKVMTDTLDGGLYHYSYAYASNTGTPSNLNTWVNRTVETLPDSNTDTVYTNSAGEVLLKVFSDLSDPANTSLVGKMWATAYQYDPQGRLLVETNPSGVTTSGGQAFLADSISGAPAGNWYLNTSGLEHVTDYYSSGTASGYQDNTYLRQGYSGTGDLQSTETYTIQLGTGGRTIIPLTTDTVYRNTGGIGSETTTFTYAFPTNSIQATSETTIHPIITATENGPGGTNADTETDTYDSFGRITSIIDGDGYIHAIAYDPATGAVISNISDQTNLALTTLSTVDGLGRPTSITDPNAHVTHIQYVDTAAVREVITTEPTVSTGLQPPVQVTRMDIANGNDYTLTVAAGGGQVETLQVCHYDPSGQLAFCDNYNDTTGITYTLPTSSANPGTLTIGGGSKYRTQYGYDLMGRQDRVATDVGNTTSSTLTTPEITLTIYDSLGRITSTWKGTDDSQFVSPQSPGPNMTLISQDVYDNNTVGDGDLTKTTQFVNGSDTRISENVFDYRDRAVLSETGLGNVSETSQPIHPTISYSVYDNLDEITTQKTYDGLSGTTTIDILTTPGLDDLSNVEGTGSPLVGQRRAWTDQMYDEQGRVYQSVQHDIDQNNGADNGTLVTYTWYDHRGNVIESKAPGGLVTKYSYDGAGRLVETSETDGESGMSWAVAGNVSGDIVLQQSMSIYDKNGNVIFSVEKLRNYQYLGLGELVTAIDPNSLANTGFSFDEARISFVGNWYDEDNRLITSVNYGNNQDDGASFLQGGVYVRPSTPSNRDANANPGDPAANGGDSVLRTDYQYDGAGRQAIVTDPRNIATRTYYDALGRTTDTTDSYQGSLSNTQPSQDPPPTFDTDRMTQYTYNGLDETTTVTDILFNAPATGQTGPLPPVQQVTTYTYGVAKGGNISINDNGLLNTVTYGLVPDQPNSGLPQLVNMPADTEMVTGYDNLGEPTLLVTRDGTTHAFVYDTLGRQISDSWTSTASYATPFISNWANQRTTAYDALGRGTTFTMLSGGTVLNQVMDVYDGLGHLVKEYQEHSGPVNTSTSQFVQYIYSTSYSSANNYSRLQILSYPKGTSTTARQINYEYSYSHGALGSNSTLAALNNSISRVSSVDDTGTASSATQLETYDYLGLDTLVRRSYVNLLRSGGQHPQIEITDLSYLVPDEFDNVSSDGGPNDPNVGLDRFGRIVYENWDNLIDYRRIYGYDADGNLLYSKDPGTTIYDEWQSEINHDNGLTAATAYDKLNRPSVFRRGVLSADGLSVDQTGGGNEQGVTLLETTINYGAPGGTYGQTAATNAPGVDASVVYQKSLPNPSTVYDFGSTITSNRRDTFLTYDAWGELVGESFASPHFVTGTSYSYNVGGSDSSNSRPFDNAYQYDALGRRISETTTNRNGAITTDDLYYDSSGNVIQENISGQSAPTQYVFSAASPGMVIERDDIDPTTSLPRRVWVFQGPDRSTLALYQDASGGSVAVERILYTPMGMATFMDLGPTSYSFTDLGNFDYRYTWHGGRIERDQDFGIYTSAVVDRQSGLMLLNGAEYDSTSGNPLIQDKYAFFRPSTQPGEFIVNANEYSPRGSVNTQFPLAGSDPSWNDSFWAALSQDPVMQGFDALFDPFSFGANTPNGGYAYSTGQLSQSWGANFIGGFLSPGSYGSASIVTPSTTVSNISKYAGWVSTAAFTAASFGAYTAALGVGAGALTFAGVGAVGAGVGAGISYARGGSVGSGAFNGALLATNIGSVAPEWAAAGFAAGIEVTGNAATRVGERLFGGVEVADFAAESGEVGGQLYGSERLDKLKAYLEKRNVSLEVGSPDLGANSAGEFRISKDGTVRLLLKENPTNELVWHELGHFIQWRNLGSDAYVALPRVIGNNAPEQFVFDLLNQPGRWSRLSSGYRLHMVNYITNTWGGMGR